jgi:hypothetical protein
MVSDPHNWLKITLTISLLTLAVAQGTVEPFQTSTHIFKVGWGVVAIIAGIVISVLICVISKSAKNPL